MGAAADGRTRRAGDDDHEVERRGSQGLPQVLCRRRPDPPPPPPRTHHCFYLTLCDPFFMAFFLVTKVGYYIQVFVTSSSVVSHVVSLVPFHSEVCAYWSPLVTSRLFDVLRVGPAFNSCPRLITADYRRLEDNIEYY